jgi:hypothetical protein
MLMYGKITAEVGRVLLLLRDPIFFAHNFLRLIGRITLVAGRIDNEHISIVSGINISYGRKSHSILRQPKIFHSGKTGKLLSSLAEYVRDRGD